MSDVRKLDSSSSVVLLRAANRALGRQRGFLDLLREEGDLTAGQIELLEQVEGCCQCSGSYVRDILNHLTADDRDAAGRLSDADILGDLGRKAEQ